MKARDLLATWAERPLDFDSQLEARDEVVADAIRLRDQIKEWGLGNKDVDRVVGELNYLMTICDGAFMLLRQTIDALVAYGVAPSREALLEMLPGDIPAPGLPR